MSGRPDVTAILVNWNGREWLKGVLDGLRAQQGVTLSIVVVDNDSRDGSVEWLGEHAPDVTLVRNPSNLGFAGGVNRGLARVTSPFVMLVNPDISLPAAYAATLVGELESRPPAGSATGTLLLPDGRVDSTGHVPYRNGGAGNRDHGLRAPACMHRGVNEVFGVCAAAAVYRTAALHDVELQDDGVLCELFFAYLEDVDLDWRLRWRGWTALHVPTAVATHHLSGTGARRHAFVRRHIVKNHPALVVRHYPTGCLVRHAAEVALMGAMSTALYSSASPGALLGLVDFVQLLPRLLHQRREIRVRRRITPAQMHGWLQPYPYREKAARGLVKVRAHTA
jgi:GT2 family glycosyltransferase